MLKHSKQRKPAILILRYPSYSIKLKKRIVRVFNMQQEMSMQQDMGNLREELSLMQEKLYHVEQEKERAVDELREMKKVAEAANMRLSEAMSTEKVADIYTEYGVVKESLKNAKQELNTKEKHIDYLKIQLGKRKELERKLEEKDIYLEKLTDELSNLKTSEALTSDLLSDSEKRMEILEVELENEKKSGEKVLDILSELTKQLEATKVSLEEARIEISCLRLVAENMEKPSHKVLAGSRTMPKNFHIMEEDYDMEDDAKHGIADVMSILKEREFLKSELKFATEAEENSKKAMDDLALALQEVATEAKDLKEKLDSTNEQLELAKAEVKKLKLDFSKTEASFKVHMMESRKEADRFRNRADRLRIEADETLLTWTGKETGFVNCIKRVEEENSALQEENRKLHELCIDLERLTKSAKQETKQVRDILKQAVNEANVAKEAAGIARAENSQLKDALAEKDRALNFISHENENLKINEAAANQNINELKRLLSEKDQESTRMEQNSQEPNKERKKSRKNSMNLKELILPSKPPKDGCEPVHEEESSGEELNPFKGSIFDNVVSPMLQATHHRKMSSSAFTEFAESMNLEEFDQMEGGIGDDMDGDKNSRKKKALLRRFGDLIRRRSFHRKEPSIDLTQKPNANANTNTNTNTNTCD
ncbi:hypothetical protein ACFE04_020835 [Oxalis oulophora]